MGFNFHGNNFSNSKFFFLFFCFRVYHKINGNDLSNVKICDFFFHCWHVHRVGAALAPCRRSEKKKKTPLGHRSPVSHTSIRV